MATKEDKDLLNSKFEALKEIILGPDVEALTNRIELLEKKLVEDNTAVVQGTDAQFEALSQKMESLFDKLTQRIQSLHEELDDKKTDRRKLGDLLIKLGENLKK